MESEPFLRAFHAAHPGVTRRAFGTGSYARLAARIPAGARVLDLGCGDGPLLALVPGAIGLDVARAELAAATGVVVQGRAQALPFAAAAFDVVACHLALMLFDDAPAVVAELTRVLAPGGRLLAVLGGGPVALAPDTAPGATSDAFHRFLALLPARGRRLGDPRLRTEAGWRALLPGWALAPWERWALDLAGTPDEVWPLLGGSYEVTAEAAPTLRTAWMEAIADLVAPDGRVPCQAAVYLAEARRPG